MTDPMGQDVIMTTAQHGRDWLDIATLVVGVITLFFLVKYTNLAKKQRDEAKRANDLTERALRTADVNGELQNRSWVIARILGRTAGATKLEHFYYCELSNVGRIPATSVKVRSFSTIAPTIPESLRLIDDAVDLGEGILAPNQGGTLETRGHRISPDSEQIAELSHERLVWYFGCEIDYLDWFQKPRRTVMCWHYSWRNQGWMPTSKHNRLE
jgi:hypothetical protein